MPKIWLVLVLLILIIGIYLNRVYANFYDTIGDRHLTSPFKNPIVNIFSGNGTRGITFVSLGSSLTAGVGSTDERETVPYQYALNLSQTQGNVTLVDLGIPGATLKDVLDTELPKALSYHPNIVMVEIGTNDVHNFVPLATFKQEYISLLTSLTQNHSTQIIALTIPYLGSDRDVKFPFTALLDFQTQRYNQVIKQVAKQYPVKLIDLYALSRPISQSTPGFYAPDLFHPSALGYMIWSKLIINAS